MKAKLGFRRLDWLLLLAFAVVVSALYPQAVFQGKTIWGGPDEMINEVPMMYLAAKAVQHGWLPLWNSYNFCGGTGIGSAALYFLYPLNLLLFRLAPPRLLPLAATWRMLFEAWLMLAAYYLLFLKIWRDRPLAVLSTLIASLSPAALMYIGQGNMACLWPAFILYVLWDWPERDMRLNILYLTPALFLEGAGGHRQLSPYYLLFIFAVTLVRAVHFRSSLWRLFELWAVAGLLALGLDSLEIVPFVQEFARSTRVATSYAASLATWGPPWYLSLRFLMPEMLGTCFTFPLIQGNGDLYYNQAFLAYGGVATAFLCLFAAAKLRKDTTAWTVGTGLLALCCLHTPFWVIPYVLFLKAPIAHSRLSWLFPLCLAFPAPLGLQVFLESDRRSKLGWAVVAATIAAVVGLVGCGLLSQRFSLYSLLPHETWTHYPWAPWNTGPFDPRACLVGASAFFALAGGGFALLLALNAYGRLRDGGLKWSLCALLLGDLLFIGRGFSLLKQFFDSNWYPETAVTRFVATLPDRDDYHFELLTNAPFSTGPFMPWYDPNTNIPYGLHEIGGTGCVLNARYSMLATDGAGSRDLRSLTYQSLISPDIANVLAAKYFVAPNAPAFLGVYRPIFRTSQTVVLENPAVPSRFHLACRAVAAPDSSLPSFLRLLHSGRVDLRKAVISDPETGFVGDWSRCRESPSDTLRIRETRSGLIEGSAHLARPQLLAVTESFYPGWKASVNGKPASIHKVNYDFQAVELPAGDSRIELHYEFPHYAAAWAFTLGCLAVLLTLAAWPGLAAFWRQAARPARGRAR